MRDTHLWRLNPEIDFLNHGSFGAMPRAVWEIQRQWIAQLESDPVEFLAPERSLRPKLSVVRNSIADLVSADATDIAFVRNATEGVNAVLRSFPFSEGDEVVITSHGYNACNNAARYATERFNANVVVAELPFPISSADQAVEAIRRVLSAKTRLLLVDHVTSPTGLVLPIRPIVELAKTHQVRVIVDGAHAPGMVPVDLISLGADYYTANHHKWLCGPKTSGFLYVRKDLQEEVRPAIISHGANSEDLGESKFLAEFNWVGTYDPTPLLSVPASIDFLSTLRPGGLGQLMSENHELVTAGRAVLLEALKLDAPAPSDMLGSLASIALPLGRKASKPKLDAFQKQLFTKHRIEVPIFQLDDGTPCLRISAQAYNHLEQYERLAEVLCRELPDLGGSSI